MVTLSYLSLIMRHYVYTKKTSSKIRIQQISEIWHWLLAVAFTCFVWSITAAYSLDYFNIIEVSRGRSAEENSILTLVIFFIASFFAIALRYALPSSQYDYTKDKYGDVCLSKKESFLANIITVILLLTSLTLVWIEIVVSTIFH